MLKGRGILSSVQRRTISCLSELPDATHFYLTGGTALAEFYLGHRKSYDLDLFTAESGLILPFSRLAEDHFRKEGLIVGVTRRFSSFVEFEVSEKEEITRVQFALDTPFRLDDPVRSELGLRINDYRDLVVDKLQAFFGRTEARDAIDLFFILNTENLWELSALAKKKGSWIRSLLAGCGHGKDSGISRRNREMACRDDYQCRRKKRQRPVLSSGQGNLG